jgi:GAF domain-containing protein
MLQVASLETLLQIAMEQARLLTKAEFCSVMLVDVDKMELIIYVRIIQNHSKLKSSLHYTYLSLDVVLRLFHTGYVINDSPKNLFDLIRVRHFYDS